MKQRFGSGWTVAALAVALVALAPSLTVLWSLTAPASENWAHLSATVLPTYVWNTLKLMGLVALITAFIGVGTAWLVVSTRFPGQRILNWALVMPLATPGYIVAYVYTDLLSFAGPVQTALRGVTGWGAADYYFPPVRSLPGAAIMLGLVLYPYVYLLARTAFQRQSAALFDAARMLGARPWRAFIRVALPCARPAIAGGLALVLMETISDFGVVDYFAVQTLTTGIFRTWFNLGDALAAAQIAAWLFVFALALVFIEMVSRRGRVANPLSRDMAAQPRTLKGVRGWAALIACSLPVLLGFVVPALVLLRYAILEGDPLFGRRFLDFAWNSLTVAGVAAALTTLLALLLTYGERLHPTRFNRVSIRLATLGYALPGAMIAIGILTLSTDIDRAFGSFANNHLGFSPGLILTGSIAGLVFAYVARFLTAAFNATHSGLEKIHPTLDAAARSLGASPRRVLGAIHVPLLRGALASAALIVFIDVMKELPATLLLRPFNFETLATRTYRLASDERLAEASTAALAIVALGLIPTILLSLSLFRSSARRGLVPVHTEK
ncbi:binding-protein-dependent transport systems inner membrane component [Parvibaculum lavamentivorans DS-1]|uniref:Binding-protein-dependent transport systems inner membrane component n=1 Tax=Parvibaculum lavamentivorans (strain DS-1 / DSM 13023 / NCIMB 13966) TaxID=402881 RepID=A7HPG7_PARL1|nr:iron ABC transporter permease [Parvibaculum lavamentivorans]ABS61800.1 binding-protein-dependent transport systems inner membrane component [Parvibaculum lavamentivorans DS-1]